MHNCDICPAKIDDGKELMIDGLTLCSVCYGDVMILGYYFPEIDDRYGIKPDLKAITSNKSKDKPITTEEINLMKWELENRSPWEELEGDK